GGQVASGGTLDLGVAGGLSLESLQNSSTSEGFNFGLSMSTSSFSVNGGMNEADRRFTDDITSLVGVDNVTVTVGDNTHLLASLIASEEGLVDLTTGSLTYANLQDTDQSMSVGGSIGVGTPADGAATVDSLGFDYSNKDLQGYTQATIGDGTITILDQDADGNIAGLNRDTNSVQIITVDKEFSISLDIPVKQLREMPENIQKTVNLARALSATVPSDVKAMGPRGSELYRKMIANGLSAEEANAFAQSDAFSTTLAQFKSIDALIAAGSLTAEEKAIAAHLLAQSEELAWDEARGLIVVTSCNTASAPTSPSTQVCGVPVSDLNGDGQKTVDEAKVALDGLIGAYKSALANGNTGQIIALEKQIAACTHLWDQAYGDGFADHALAQGLPYEVVQRGGGPNLGSVRGARSRGNGPVRATLLFSRNSLTSANEQNRSVQIFQNQSRNHPASGHVLCAFSFKFASS
ncbi:MAG: hypothetical protein ACPGVN_08500, partial [Alphaproteobacteria bacterium]